MTTRPFGFDYGDSIPTHFLDGTGVFRALTKAEIATIYPSYELLQGSAHEIITDSDGNILYVEVKR